MAYARRRAYGRRRVYRRTSMFGRRRASAFRRRPVRTVRRRRAYYSKSQSKPQITITEPKEESFLKQIKSQIGHAPSKDNFEQLKDILAIPAIIEKHKESLKPKPLSLASLGYPTDDPVLGGYKGAALYPGGIWTDPVNGKPTLKEPVEWYTRQQAWLSRSLYNLPQLANKKINIYQVNQGGEPTLIEDVIIDTETDDKQKGRWLHQATGYGPATWARSYRTATDDDANWGQVLSSGLNAAGLAYGARGMKPGMNEPNDAPYGQMAAAGLAGAGAGAMGLNIDTALRSAFPQPYRGRDPIRPGTPTTLGQQYRATSPTNFGGGQARAASPQPAVTAQLPIGSGMTSAFSTVIDLGTKAAKKLAKKAKDELRKTREDFSGAPQVAPTFSSNQAQRFDKTQMQPLHITQSDQEPPSLIGLGNNAARSTPYSRRQQESLTNQMVDILSDPTNKYTHDAGVRLPPEFHQPLSQKEQMDQQDAIALQRKKPRRRLKFPDEDTRRFYANVQHAKKTSPRYDRSQSPNDDDI